MNLPGRANTKVPDDTAGVLPVADLRCWVWVNSPRAALVPATKDLNCSRALAQAEPVRASALAASTVARMVFIFMFVIDDSLFCLRRRHQDVAVAVRLHRRHQAA